MSAWDTLGSLTRRTALAVCLLAGATSAAFAQGPIEPGVTDAPAWPDFLARYDFHLSAAALGSGDQRFSWETRFGGDFDLVDYVKGRVNVLIDYEALCGSQYRPFDPLQGNYVLETSASARPALAEIAGVFHHESRHLGDRPKDFAVAWNSVGVRLLKRVPMGGGAVDVRISALKVIQTSYVDYDLMGDVDVLLRRPINDRVGVFARAFGQALTVDGTRPGRTSQAGGRAELGMRLNGKAGAAELFVGVERRLDADQLEMLPQQWALAGLRIVAR